MMSEQRVTCEQECLCLSSLMTTQLTANSCWLRMIFLEKSDYISLLHFPVFVFTGTEAKHGQTE